MRTGTIAVTSVLGLALLTIARPPASARRTMTGSPEGQLKTQLRNLVTAEEKFWAEHGTYTTDVSQLGMFRAKSTSTDSIWAQVLYAGGRSWSGRALYRGRIARSCAIYVGTPSDFPSQPVTEADSVRATEEGAPVCDKF
jgi:hypothetical protein